MRWIWWCIGGAVVIAAMGISVLEIQTNGPGVITQSSGRRGGTVAWLAELVGHYTVAYFFCAVGVVLGASMIRHGLKQRKAG